MQHTILETIFLLQRWKYQGFCQKLQLFTTRESRLIGLLEKMPDLNETPPPPFICPLGGENCHIRQLDGMKKKNEKARWIYNKRICIYLKQYQ